MFLHSDKKKQRGVVEVPNLSKVLKELSKSMDQEEKERALISESADLTPGSVSGKKRRYHYKDVNIVVKWQYGGRYGKTCENIGMKRGDPLELLPPENAEEDPDMVAIVWNGTKIGYMKSNRLRSMVHQWQKAELPVLAVVSKAGGEQKLYIEFAFYGTPKS